MQVAALCAVLRVYLANLIVNHELLVEAVTFGCLVIGVHEVVDGHGLGAVLLTNPVGVRQVDTDRRSGITIAGKNSRRDDLGGNAFHFLFLVFGVSRGVVFKPLCVLGNELCTLGGCQVFEVNHRFPCTGDTQRVGIGLCEAVDEVHATVKVLHPCNAILVEETQIACFIEGDHLLDSEFLCVVLRKRKGFFEPINNVLERFTVQAAYFIDALLDLAVLVLDELRVQTYPQRFIGSVFVCLIPCLSLSLRHAFAVVVTGRAGYQIHAILGGGALRHHSRVEHHG